MANRNQLLFQIGTAVGAGKISPSSNQNFLLSAISVAIGGAGDADNNRNILLSQIATALEQGPLPSDNRNILITKIIKGYIPGFVYTDENRNDLLNIWLGILTASLLTNGNFDTDTDWTKGTGWTIANGSASCDGTQIADSNLAQVVAITDTVSYDVQMVVGAYSAGTITPVIGGTLGTARSADGVFTETIVAGAGGSIEFRANAAFIGSIKYGLLVAA